MRRSVILTLLIISAICALSAILFWQPFWWGFVVLLPLLLVAIYDIAQKEHAILRNFPIFGHGRYIADWMRPKIYQYFVEPNHDGRPFSRIFRTIAYARAKSELDTNPFGTQYNVYEEGYEWMNHSIAALDHHSLDAHPRVLIGGKDCKQPYSASILNISAMSYGSLSKNAVLALNGGAQISEFAHNTGEGGVSPYHLEQKGDLIYQIGTGYFGCRAKDGSFDPEEFKKRCASPQIKMIELKLSQGAKPGHGGILPGKKVSEEIARIRGVEPGQDVLSPPHHRAFSNPIELLNFIRALRDLSGGKPVGFKLCIGHKAEFLSICKAMIKTKIKPDFISVDGGEGGTGAAPLEFSNSVGMPLRDGLAFVYNALEGFGIKQDIKLIASGKIINGFHIFRALALGADLCYSARAMMFALGCIQARECNRNTCPTGITTQDKHLMAGLVVQEKKQHVARYHNETVKSFVELLAASGMKEPDQVNRSHVYRRIVMNMNQRYDQIYPYIPKGCLLNEGSTPKEWRDNMSLADAGTFMIRQPSERLHL